MNLRSVAEPSHGRHPEGCDVACDWGNVALVEKSFSVGVDFRRTLDAHAQDTVQHVNRTAAPLRASPPIRARPIRVSN